MCFTRVLLMTGSLIVGMTLLLAGCFGGEEPHSVMPKLVKSVSGFKNPESVVFDRKRNVFYVSQANFGQATGGGAISLLSESGEITELNWVSELNHPKGLGIIGDKLFVADVTEVVEIDIAAGKVIKKHSIEGSLFLNDVAVGADGAVYVSDTLADQVYYLKSGGEFEPFFKNETVKGPNGLKVIDGDLYVAGWGDIPGKTMDDLGKASPNGRLLKVDVDTRRITVLSKKGVGNLDGIEPDGRGNVYVTDWIAGKLFHIKLDGTMIKSFDIAKTLGKESAKGLADLAFLQDKRQIWAPMMLSGFMHVFSVADAKGSN